MRAPALENPGWVGLVAILIPTNRYNFLAGSASSPSPRITIQVIPRSLFPFLFPFPFPFLIPFPFNKYIIQIIENQQICKKSILQSRYTQIQISRNYFSNKRQNINLGDGHMAKLGEFHQQGFARWVAIWDTKMVITPVPAYPQGSLRNHPTISPNVLPCPKGSNFN